MTLLSIYQAAVPLHPDTHKDLRFTAKHDFNFAKSISSSPVTGPEFFESSRDFPVLFIKDKEGNYSPTALFSLTQKQNYFVNEDGSWSNTYAPAFLRQYPFLLAAQGTVFIDEKAPHFQDEAGLLLFNEDGKQAADLT